MAAARIAKELIAHGVPTFYSPTNIRGAQQWQNEILAALQRCDWFIVLLSPDAIESMWVKRETSMALKDPRFEDRIIPLRYRSCDLGTLAWLETLQMIDFERNFAAGLRELLRIWSIARDTKPKR